MKSKQLQYNLEQRMMLFEDKLISDIDVLSAKSFYLGYHSAIQNHSQRVDFLTYYFLNVMGMCIDAKYIMVNPLFYHKTGCKDVNRLTIISSNSIPNGNFLVCT